MPTGLNLPLPTSGPSSSTLLGTMVPAFRVATHLSQPMLRLHGLGPWDASNGSQTQHAALLPMTQAHNSRCGGD